MSLHPLVVAAAEGTLPPWSRANPERIEHMGRVAELLGDWAVERGLTEEDVLRWRAAGFLHDALREADPEEIRSLLPTELLELPDYMVHGPAAASRLRREGVFDEPFLRAIAYHTIGHPDLDLLGRAVYVADFLEPGRKLLAEWRASLRVRMPEHPSSVAREVVAVRIRHLLEEIVSIPAETCEFWNVLIRELDG